jgi:hypothetical protein
MLMELSACILNNYIIIHKAIRSVCCMHITKRATLSCCVLSPASLLSEEIVKVSTYSDSPVLVRDYGEIMTVKRN